MKKSLNRIKVLTIRNIKEIIREPINLVFMIGLPLIMEILFYLIFHGMTSQFEIKYLAPGIVVFSQAFLTLFSGILIAVDRNTSFLTRLSVSETKSFEFILSYSFSLIPISLIQTILFFAVGGIIDPAFWSWTMLVGLMAGVFTSLLFIGFGILFGSICNEKSVGGVSSIIITGQSLLSGMWFPVEGLSDTFIKIMDLLPFRNATILVQNTINGYTDFVKDILIPMLITLFYTILVYVFAVFVFKKNMRKQ